MQKIYYTSPIGELLIRGNLNGIETLSFVEKKGLDSPNLFDNMAKTVNQLEEYFNGERTVFDIKLSPKGTVFQREVWKALCEIAYGKTASYGQIATIVRNTKAMRAVGRANGQNPIPIIIPCHRVIGADGKLVGFSGGLWRKRFLLELEEKTMGNSLLEF